MNSHSTNFQSMSQNYNSPFSKTGGTLQSFKDVLTSRTTIFIILFVLFLSLFYIYGGCFFIYCHISIATYVPIVVTISIC